MKSSATGATANPAAKATRPTSPAPIRNASAGFTFVETIIALAICVILLSVVAQSLLASLRAEQTTSWLQEGNLICDRIAAAHCTGLSVTDVITSVKSAWTVSDVAVRDGDVEWRVWSANPVDRPSLIVKTTFREK